MRMSCLKCGTPIEPERAGDPRPHCGSRDRTLEDADSFHLTDAEVEIREYRMWQANNLTLFGIVYAALVTISGVVAATFHNGHWVWLWAIASAVVGALAAVFKGPIILMMNRYLDWKGLRGEKRDLGEQGQGSPVDPHNP